MANQNLTEKEASERLEDSRNLANLLGVGNRVTGRGGRKMEKIAHLRPPEEVKVYLGALTQIEGPTAVKNATGVNEKMLRRLSQGCTNRNTFSEELKEKVDAKAEDIKSEISNTALDRIKMALESITDSKLIDSKPREAAATAKDLATVLEKMGPSKDGHAFITFNVYAPPKNKEDKYRVVEVETADR